MSPVHTDEMDRAMLGEFRASRIHLFRKSMKSEGDNSPEATANSRCLILPRPTVAEICTLYGGSANTMAARSRPMSLAKWETSQASPHKRRWLPDCQRSP